MAAKSSIPIPVIRRLSHYLHHLRNHADPDREWISSLDLAAALDVTSSTVRQDLSCLDICGIAKRGYRIEDLVNAITTVLGRDRLRNMVIVGAGNLGRALGLHGDFSRRGFVVRAMFDASPAVVGTRIGEFTVLGMDELPRVVSEMDVEIGVVAVPHESAQDVTDALVAAGVRGVLNMTAAHVRAPLETSVVNVRMYASLSLLSYALRARELEHLGH